MSAKVRVTVEQGKLVFGAVKPGVVKLPRSKVKREDLPENQVAQPIIDFLKLKGWRVERQQSGLFQRPGVTDPTKRTRIGRKGMLDWRCTRLVSAADPRKNISIQYYFELEMKAPGKMPSDDQCTYIRHLQAVGITAVWFDSFHDFQHWYRVFFPEECRHMFARD